jgi:hypothetical protein
VAASCKTNCCCGDSVSSKHCRKIDFSYRIKFLNGKFIRKSFRVKPFPYCCQALLHLQTFFARPAEQVTPELIFFLLVKRQPSDKLLWGLIVESEASDKTIPPVMRVASIVQSTRQ